VSVEASRRQQNGPAEPGRKLARAHLKLKSQMSF
jgi:hypothetical protein